MNDSIHLHIILLYNLFPFQVLFLCILKVRMIQIRTSYYCSCNRKLLSIFRSQVASGHLDKTVRFWDIRWEYVTYILRVVVDNLMDSDLLSMWAVPKRTMGEGERGEGGEGRRFSPHPLPYHFLFCPRFYFRAVQSLTLRTTNKKTVSYAGYNWNGKWATYK